MDLASAQGCPALGMSLPDLQLALGGKVDSDSSGGAIKNSWTKLMSPGVRLTAELEQGRVVGWAVSGNVTSRVAKPSPYWSLDNRKGFPQRVEQYVERFHPSEKTAFAMFRACPYEGMTVGQVEASWGTLRGPTAAEVNQALTKHFVIGVEGQFLEFRFIRDSLTHTRAHW
jgi:hypothetical protein